MNDSSGPSNIPAAGLAAISDEEKEDGIDEQQQLVLLLPKLPKGINFAIGSFIFVVAVLGFFGNSIILIVLSRTKKLRKRYCLVLQFTLCHLLAAFCYLGVGFKAVSNQRLLPRSFACITDGFLLGVSAISAIYVMVLIAVEHYLVTQYPFVIQRLTTSHKLLLVSLAYAIALFTTTPPFYGWGVPIRPLGYGWYCSFDMYDRSFNNRTYFIFLYSMAFIFPFSLMVILYVIIWRTSFSSNMLNSERKTSNRYSAQQMKNLAVTDRKISSAQHAQRQIKFLRTSISVVTSFCFAWLPFATVAAIVQMLNVLLPPMTIELCALFAKMFILWNPTMHFLNDARFRSECVRSWQAFKARLSSLSPGGPNNNSSHQNNSHLTNGGAKSALLGGVSSNSTPNIQRRRATCDTLFHVTSPQPRRGVKKPLLPYAAHPHQINHGLSNHHHRDNTIAERKLNESSAADWSVESGYEVCSPPAPTAGAGDEVFGFKPEASVTSSSANTCGSAPHHNQQQLQQTHRRNRFGIRINQGMYRQPKPPVYPKWSLATPPAVSAAFFDELDEKEDLGLTAASTAAKEETEEDRKDEFNFFEEEVIMKEFVPPFVDKINNDDHSKTKTTTDEDGEDGGDRTKEMHETANIVIYCPNNPLGVTFPNKTKTSSTDHAAIHQKPQQPAASRKWTNDDNHTRSTIIHRSAAEMKDTTKNANDDVIFEVLI